MCSSEDPSRNAKKIQHRGQPTVQVRLLIRIGPFQLGELIIVKLHESDV